MAEKEGAGSARSKGVDPDLRFKYLGFEVKSGKIGDLFSSEAERESWVKRVLEKRKKGTRLREACSLEEPRVAPYERVVLSITSVFLILSLFLPWFSGYREFEVEKAPAQQTATATGTTAQKDASGFASVEFAKSNKELKRENYSVSALGALASIGNYGGKAFSSGFAVMLTALIFIIYILSCIGLAVYTLYAIYGIKGDEDTRALAMKRILKWNWAPVAVWVFGILVSLIGGSYSFDTTQAVKQIGTSYGISTYLGLLSYGFYLSLAAFVMNGVKAMEI